MRNVEIYQPLATFLQKKSPDINAGGLILNVGDNIGDLVPPVAEDWYRYHRSDIGGTIKVLRAVPTHRYDGTIGAIFSYYQ